MPMDHDAATATKEGQLRDLLANAQRRASAAYARLRIRSLPTSRGSLAYFELGDPDGTPLLCLHGLSVSGYFFEQYHDHFVQRGIRAIAPCLLGGIYVPDPAKTIDALARETLELLDVLGVDRFDLIGFSWGTLPALELLARAPGRIGKAGLLGPMLPMSFIEAPELAQMKADIRHSFAMVRHAPWLHRGLMELVCRLPLSVLVKQFQDDRISPAEALALAPGSAFRTQLMGCIDECVGTGAGFFTQGWRMFLDSPGYALHDLATVASRVDVRLYIGERDNVHLPSFAAKLAGAFSGIETVTLEAGDETGDTFAPAYTRDGCSVWMTPDAGRIACMLHFQAALDHLMSPAAGPEPSPPALLSTVGGSIVVPDKVLCDRLDGGHLIVNPPRPVWERSALTPAELAAWSLLVAATGRAMLDVLPVLRDGCVNYWEAGNWALNDLAAPRGPKGVRAHRRVHLHLFGRSRQARDPDWRWGEAPRFPTYADSVSWAARFAPLSKTECEAVSARVSELLATEYRLSA